jgi:hypothetical protein
MRKNDGRKREGVVKINMEARREEKNMVLQRSYP